MKIISCVAFYSHRYFYQLIKACLFLFVLSFLWLQIRIASFKPEYPLSKNDVVVPNIILNKTIVTRLTTVSLPFHQLKHIIDKSNQEQVIINKEVLSPLEPDDIVIVVQVHKRLHYLYSLIESLRQAQGIENTLLVFSHDFYDPNINALVKSIDFCKVIQIFYPNSIQLHPNEFPGEDPNDCPRDIPKQRAVKTGCNNANFPDLYGHYREARFTQTKHHWWWKINFVMDKLVVTQGHRGPVIFLEEDHYVSPDFLQYLSKLIQLKNEKCPSCSILCLGAYTKVPNYALNSKKVEWTKWHSSKHNMGMVVDRELWNQLRKCGPSFCQFDDYNWDWSLQHVSSVCLSKPLMTLVPLAPRVFHIGECGIHHKGRDCSSSAIIEKVVAMLSDAEGSLFPDKLYLKYTLPRQPKQPKGNGGWGDTRDHDLCLSHVNASPAN